MFHCIFCLTLFVCTQLHNIFLSKTNKNTQLYGFVDYLMPVPVYIYIKYI